MEKLENMCVEKIKAMKQAYLSPEAERCKFNCDGYNFECNFYIPIKLTQIPVRRGIYAYELMRS